MNARTPLPDPLPPLPLWPAGHVPHAPVVANGAPPTVPTITVYPAPPDVAPGPAVVICPGGGYGMLADHEGEPVARWLQSLGVAGAVLRYRLGPTHQHPAMLADVSRALRMVRARAGEWRADPKRVGVLGFSAGGHLASSVTVHGGAGDPASPDTIEREGARPDFAVLIYPVISLNDPALAHGGSRRNLLGDNPDPALVAFLSTDTQVTPQTPPTFLVHSADDEAVPVGNSLRFAAALAQNNVPVGMQIYHKGGHGYGLGNESAPETLQWPAACAAWLYALGVAD